MIDCVKCGFSIEEIPTYLADDNPYHLECAFPHGVSLHIGSPIRIVAAAICYDGIIFSVPRPGRHANVSNWMGSHGMTGEEQMNQGFLTSNGRFVDRKEGCTIAKAAGQIINKTGGENTLYSEDLW